jgi:hypothetical protein
MCWGRQNGCDRDHPDLTGPRVEVAEDFTMERPQVVQVIATGQDAGAQIRQCDERQACLDLSQPLLVDDAEPVAQHAVAGIEIRIDRHDTPYSWRTRSRICEVLISPRAHRSAIASTSASAASPSARRDAAA